MPAAARVEQAGADTRRDVARWKPPLVGAGWTGDRHHQAPTVGLPGIGPGGCAQPVHRRLGGKGQAAAEGPHNVALEASTREPAAGDAALDVLRCEVADGSAQRAGHPGANSEPLHQGKRSCHCGVDDDLGQICSGGAFEDYVPVRAATERSGARSDGTGSHRSSGIPNPRRGAANRTEPRGSGSPAVRRGATNWGVPRGTGYRRGLRDTSATVFALDAAESLRSMRYWSPNARAGSRPS